MSALASSALSAPTKTGGTEDGELVRRIRRGDERAFEVLYQRYNRRITAYIHGMVHDHARAEDVAQDVFVSALRRIRETDRPIAFKPWIYEIAKNACIDQFRRSKRAEEVSYDADEGLGAADYGRLVSADAMPETELESKTNLDHLRGAFGGLSETHHEILVMRELEGLSYREIGERLGMSRPSVESTLFRARRRLTEEYEELVSGARCQRIHAIIADAQATMPGARDQRRLARHISHCQPCRRQARLAGLDIPVTADRPMRQRIAALLPLPLFLRRWMGVDGSDASAVGGNHLSTVAQWSSQFGTFADPSWLKAAAAAATVVVAGAGAGFAGRTTTPTSPAGSLDQLVSGLQTEGAENARSSSSEAARNVSTVPAVTSALAAANAFAGALSAASATSSSTASASATTKTSTTAAPSSGSGGQGGSGANAPATPASGLPDAAGAAQTAAGQVQSVTNGGGGGGSGSTGSGSSGGDPTATPAPSAPNVETPDVDASAPASAPSVTPPGTSGATDAAQDAADAAGGAVGGASGGTTDKTGGAGSLLGGG